MKHKLLLILFFVIFIIVFSNLISAITTINPNVVYPGDRITITIKPTNAGFYNVIYVMKNTSVVDSISVSCQTICRQRRTVYYTVPANFLEEYYFATFDYAINDYELDYFNVIEQGGAPSGQLIITEIRNSDSTLNFLINPQQGKYANITILTELKLKGCESYNVNAYLCNSTLYSACNYGNYTYKILLKFDHRVSRTCYFKYVGDNYFPFYAPPGTWKIIAKSGVAKDQKDFTYSQLKAVDYTAFINFGALNARMWNTGVPIDGLNLTNQGNVPITIRWSSSGFSCVSPNCTDFWPTFYQGENTFQIDDDNLFIEGNETGFNPVFITNYSLNFFPQGNLSVCISDWCNNSIGERIKTYYNLKLPNIHRGDYQGNITMISY